MERREQPDWTETVEDPAADSTGAEAEEPGLDPATPGEGTVAQRLKRVTRYASEASRTDPAEPAATPDQSVQQAAGSAGSVHGDPAAARHEPEPSIDELLQPAPVAPARPEASAEEATGQRSAPAADAPPRPASSEQPRPEPAPAVDTARSMASRETPHPVVPEVEAPVEEPAAIADIEPTPPPVASEAAAAEPAIVETEVAAPAEASPEPAAVQAQHGIPPAARPEDAGPTPESPKPAALESPEPAAAAPEPAAADGEVLTVGRGIRLVAKLCECAELLVDGHLEATARASHLMVGRGGRFIGSAEVDTAEIHGHFEGNLTVAKRLYIPATGSVAGTTCYQEIVIDAGGQVMGNAQRLSEPAAAGDSAA